MRKIKCTTHFLLGSLFSSNSHEADTFFSKIICSLFAVKKF